MTVAFGAPLVSTVALAVEQVFAAAVWYGFHGSGFTVMEGARCWIWQLLTNVEDRQVKGSFCLKGGPRKRRK